MKQLYREAKYFELGSLRTEIEKRLGIVMGKLFNPLDRYHVCAHDSGQTTG